MASVMAEVTSYTRKVVLFPLRAKVEARKDDVERINQFEFFELGETLQALKDLTAATEIAPDNALFPFWSAHRAVEALEEGKPLELSVSKACVTRLKNALWSFLEVYCRTDGEDGKRNWKFHGADAPPIASWQWHDVSDALRDFETIFREEMREAAIYRVPPRGIFDTAKLVDDADKSFPAEIAMVIPDKTREDWRAAGRCLAFALLSASGFHVARAVEGTLESYYQQSHRPWRWADDKKATLKSWNDYIVRRSKKPAQQPDGRLDLAPGEKVIAELETQTKDDYRNPIAHPRIVLSQTDARMLFSNGELRLKSSPWRRRYKKAAMPKPSAPNGPKDPGMGFGTVLDSRGGATG